MLRFLFEDVDILLDRGIGGVGSPNQVDVIDDRGERRLDVVRHIGNQFGFHALGADTVIQRALQTVADVVDRSREFRLAPVEMCGIQEPLAAVRLRVQRADGTRNLIVLGLLLIEMLVEPEIQNAEEKCEGQRLKACIQRLSV